MKAASYLFVIPFTFTLAIGYSVAGNSQHRGDWNAFEIEGLAQPLLGLVYSGTGLEFQVPSTGCTEKPHFVVQRLSPEGRKTTQLLLIRVVPDYCDAYVPFGVRIFYGYEELGLEEGDAFTVLNPLSRYRVRSEF
jgi:hypothetical protein